MNVSLKIPPLNSLMERKYKLLEYGIPNCLTAINGCTRHSSNKFDSALVCTLIPNS